MGNATDSWTAPRMFPAIAIVAVHLVVAGWTIRFSSAHFDGMIGFMLMPVIVLICLVVWWLWTGNVPRRDRVLGLALFCAALAGPTAFQGVFAVFFLIIALPAFTTGTVLSLLLSTPLEWSKRRWVPVGLLVCMGALFTGLRVDEVSGAFVPVLSWRWKPAVTSSGMAAEFDLDPQSNRVATLPAESGPGDWLEFRGPYRDSALAGVSFDTDWEATPPRELWRIDVGLGWSSFTVVGNYFYTQEQRGAHELVVCYEAATGDQVWLNGVEARFDDPTGSGPRGTPTYVEGKLYCQGAAGALQCLDAATGKTLWTRDVGRDTGARIPQWGFSGSPLVVGELVIEFTGADGGKSVIAYDRTAGAIAWNKGEGSHGYSSGHTAKIDGVPQLLMESNLGVQSFNLETGEVLWEERWSLSSMAPRILQPQVIGERSIVLGSGTGIGTRLFEARLDSGSWKVEEQWTSKNFRPYFNDFVHHEAYLYGYDGHRFVCVDASTGDRVWKGARMGGQVLLLSDMAVLLVLTERGKVVLLEATPEKHRRIASIQALTGKTWNHPVVANGKLFVRNDREAAAYELAIE